jgi:hypothetical protein
MTGRGDIVGCRQSSHLLTCALAGVSAVLLFVMTPPIARAARIEADTGLLSPPAVDNKAVNVKVGLLLTNLIEVDEVKEQFHISGYLLMTWKDPRLAFSPAESAAERQFNPDSIWVPRVILINATARRDTITVNIRGEPDGTIHYLELFQVELTTSFDLKAFPFDSQALEVFVSPLLDERDTMALEYDNQASGVGTQPFVELAQWKILGLQGALKLNAVDASSKKISELEIDLVVLRRYRYYIWKVFLPLLAMVAIAYSAFWIKIGDYTTQISITLTAILTEIAFLFAISTNLPKVPYLTFIDAFFLVSFVFSCACIVELVAVHQSLERNRTEFAARVRRVSLALYPVIYVAVLAVASMVFLGTRANR